MNSSKRIPWIFLLVSVAIPHQLMSQNTSELNVGGAISAPLQKAEASKNGSISFVFPMQNFVPFWNDTIPEQKESLSCKIFVGSSASGSKITSNNQRAFGNSLLNPESNGLAGGIEFVARDRIGKRFGPLLHMRFSVYQLDWQLTKVDSPGVILNEQSGLFFAGSLGLSVCPTISSQDQTWLSAVRFDLDLTVKSLSNDFSDNFLSATVGTSSPTWFGFYLGVSAKVHAAEVSFGVPVTFGPYSQGLTGAKAIPSLGVTAKIL